MHLRLKKFAAIRIAVTEPQVEVFFGDISTELTFAIEMSAINTVSIGPLLGWQRRLFSPTKLSGTGSVYPLHSNCGIPYQGEGLENR